jgi:hypothetical protein
MLLRLKILLSTGNIFGYLCREVSHREFLYWLTTEQDKLWAILSCHTGALYSYDWSVSLSGSFYQFIFSYLALCLCSHQHPVHLQFLLNAPIALQARSRAEGGEITYLCNRSWIIRKGGKCLVSFECLEYLRLFAPSELTEIFKVVQSDAHQRWVYHAQAAWIMVQESLLYKSLASELSFQGSGQSKPTHNNLHEC